MSSLLNKHGVAQDIGQCGRILGGEFATEIKLCISKMNMSWT